MFNLVIWGKWIVFEIEQIRFPNFKYFLIITIVHRVYFKGGVLFLSRVWRGEAGDPHFAKTKVKHLQKNAIKQGKWKPLQNAFGETKIAQHRSILPLKHAYASTCAHVDASCSLDMTKLVLPKMIPANQVSYKRFFCNFFALHRCSWEIPSKILTKCIFQFLRSKPASLHFPRNEDLKNWVWYKMFVFVSGLMPPFFVRERSMGYISKNRISKRTLNSTKIINKKSFRNQLYLLIQRNWNMTRNDGPQ